MRKSVTRCCAADDLGRRCFAVMVAGAFAGLILGCGPSSPAVKPVTGIVTLDGKPVADAEVGFSPLIPGQGLSAVGKTGADGSFVLNAQGARPGRGTAVGEYAVTVRKYEAPSSAQSSSDESNENLKPLVPRKYMDKSTSPLKATVSSGENSFQFELTSP